MNKKTKMNKTNNFSIPREVIEYILSKCDGKTLLEARKVSEDWRNIVNYLTQRTRIWEFCCREEMPKNELIDYYDKYMGDDKQCNSFWINIYNNWCSWQNLQEIKYTITRCPIDVPRISSTAVSGNFIAVGSEDGRVFIYNKVWNFTHVIRYLAVKVNSLAFLKCTDTNGDIDLCLVIAFHVGLVIFSYFGLEEDVIQIVYNVKQYSSYKNYLCYEKMGSRITIAKYTNDNGFRKLEDVWFSRIYSPNTITTLNMWNGICTILINRDVQYINYDNPKLNPMDALKTKTKINFNFTNYESYFSKIVRDNIVISLYKGTGKEWEEFIEIFIIDEKGECSKKLFDAWDIFRSSISCTFVYGNTFMIGTYVGNLYQYHVNNWKNLDLRMYDKKVIIGRHPIINIEAKEFENERKFYVSSRVGIHEVFGYGINHFI